MTEIEKEADEVLGIIQARQVKRVFSPRLLLMAAAYKRIKAERDALARLVDQAHHELSPPEPARIACAGSGYKENA